MSNFAGMNKIRNNIVVPATLAIIAVGSGLLDWFTPAMGDDLAFWSYLGLDEYTVPNRRTISFILAHIFGCNGRFFDYMGPVIINLLPRAVAATVMGLMAALLFCGVLSASRIPSRGHTAFSMALLAATIAVLPWWDGLFLRVCQFNYSWTAAFCLFFFAFFFKDIKIKDSTVKTAAIVAVSFFAGASHEQSAVTMCATFGLWLILNHRYRSLNSRQKVMLASLAIGSVLPIAAPAIWHRAAAESVSQSPDLLIVTTYPALIVLIAVMLGLLATRRSRNYLRGLLSSDWFTLLCAAVIACCIGIFSGIPGRTGMLTEALSIVALARMALDIKLHISRTTAAIVAATVFVLITAHFVAAVDTQRRLGAEHATMVEQYCKSSDGIIYLDFTDRLDVSPLTLYRVKGVPDADDYWNLHILESTYGNGQNKLPVVLPTALKGRLEAMCDSVTAGPVTVYSSKPDNMVATLDDVVLQYYPGPNPRAITHTVMANGREIWIATPRVRDPGDYTLPVKTIL